LFWFQVSDFNIQDSKRPDAHFGSGVEVLIIKWQEVDFQTDLGAFDSQKVKWCDFGWLSTLISNFTKLVALINWWKLKLETKT
jgi:hypothetical protein